MANRIYITPLFAVPVLNTTLDGIPESEKEYIKNLEYERVKPNDNGWINKDNVYLLDDDNLTVLREKVQNTVDTYCHEVLNVADHIEFYITNSWAIKHDKGDYAQTHFHKNSLVSGVVYIDVEETSGAFSFHGPEEYYNIFPNSFSFDYKKRDILNTTKWNVTPHTDMIMLFPSNVKHSVAKSESSNARYCVAFNTFVKGSFGEDISVVNI